ncbi:MAG: HEPN domain-containing protein [Candidatus Caldarchaeum sp.]
MLWQGLGEVEFLKRRALAFLADAQTDYERGEYDLVLFHVEQFMQLYLKHLLYRRLGDFPRTHSPLELFKQLSKAYDSTAVAEFYRSNMEMLVLLEESYISSRYLPRSYGRDIAERVLGFSTRLKEMFEWLEKT